MDETGVVTGAATDAVTGIVTDVVTCTVTGVETDAKPDFDTGVLKVRDSRAEVTCFEIKDLERAAGM